MEMIKELGGVIVMPSRESFEKLSFDKPSDTNRGLQTSKINGITTIWIEGGVINLFNKYLELSK